MATVFDKFYKVQNFFQCVIPIVLDNEPLSDVTILPAGANSSKLDCLAGQLLIRAHYQGFAAPISGYGNQPVSRSQCVPCKPKVVPPIDIVNNSQNPIVCGFQMCIDRQILLSTTYKLIQLRHYPKRDSLYDSMID